MRYSPPVYARSLFEILEKSKLAEQGAILKKFLAIVEKNGDGSRMKAIADYFEKLVVKSNGGRVVEVETARELDTVEIGKLAEFFKANDLVKRSVDPRLVAGVRIEFDGETEFDYSLARKFRKIFAVKK